jgi:hypothetical protein
MRKRRFLPFALFVLIVMVGLTVISCADKEVRLIDMLAEPFFGPQTPRGADSVDDPPLPRELVQRIRNHAHPGRDWKWIVVHHSATERGGAESFDRMHREQRGWNSLGYHFVIGNGTDTRDGEVEIGPRWAKQKHGAHCATPSNKFNRYGIGVCLVGNFEQTRPTPSQLTTLVDLLALLCAEYDVPVKNIIGHRDGQSAEGKPANELTDCPGENVDLAAIRRAVTQRLR